MMKYYYDGSLVEYLQQYQKPVLCFYVCDKLETSQVMNRGNKKGKLDVNMIRRDEITTVRCVTDQTLFPLVLQ